MQRFTEQDPSPLISVVMSVYNGMAFLEEAIDSVLSQTLTDFEFIIIDDGSTDKTWPMLTGYAAQDVRITLLRNETNLGYTRSLNRGLKLARGLFVARQDADDISAPERFEKQIAYFDAHPEVGLLGTVTNLIDDKGKILSPGFYSHLVSNTDLQKELLIDFCLAHGSVMIRRQCLDQVGPVYDVSLEPAEDHDLWLRLSEVTQVGNLAEPLYGYRQHGASVSKQRRSLQTLHWAEGVERALNRRFGPKPSVAQMLPAGRGYLRAALTAFANDNSAEARTRISKAQTAYPRLLGNFELLRTEILNFVGSYAVEKKLSFCEAVFDKLLPHTWTLAYLKNRLMSDIHMQAVFGGLQTHEREQIKRHLWPGLRSNPFWLLNRGVLVTLLRSL